MILSLFKFSGRRPKRLADPASVTTIARPPRSPNGVSSHPEAEGSHAIAPLSVAGEPEAALAAVRTAVEQDSGVKVVFVDPSRYLYATYTSKLFGFVDDVEFLVESSENGRSIIGIRSASRVGHSDLGVNRKRLETLRSRLGGD